MDFEFSLRRIPLKAAAAAAATAIFVFYNVRVANVFV